MNKKYVLLLLLSLALWGCQKEEEKYLTDFAKTAQEFLIKQRYEILEYEGTGNAYVLTEERIKELPYSQVWKLKGNDPNLYFGETVVEERFIVKNHPLDEEFGDTLVSVFVVKGKVVGGTSLPNDPNHSLTGGSYSLDGQTPD